MEMSISHRDRAEVSQEGDLWNAAKGYWSDPAEAMRLQACGDHRSTRDEGSYPHAAVDPTEAGGIGLRGVSQGEEYTDHLREVREHEVQVRKEGVLEQRVLSEHRRREQEGDPGVHPKPGRRGHHGRSTEFPGV